MRKFFITLTLFAALGVSSVNAREYPDRDRIIRTYDDNRIYRDERGEYHWQVIEREVWIPARRVGTILGSRVIPGHYERRQQRVKVYHRQSRYDYDRYNRGRNRHPHGMPPGQRKKYDDRYDNDRRDNRRDDGRWNDRDDDHQDSRRYDNNRRG